MKVLGIHIDPCHIGGHTRLFLMLMDVFKSMGHKVEIVCRESEDSVAEIQSLVLDPQTARPLLVPAQLKIKLDLGSHTIPQIKDYQPIRHLTPLDFTAESIPVCHYGDRFPTPWPEKVVQKMREADYVLTDTEMYVRIEEDIDIAEKHIQYVHFPTATTMPVYKKEPLIWSNSSFTSSWIRIRWGYNNPDYTKVGKKYVTVEIPNQIFNPEIVYPPMYVKDYENSRGFSDRPFGVVMFARLGEDKFTVANVINKHFKLLSLGAQRPVEPFKEAMSEKSLGAVQVDLNLPRKKTFKPYNPKGNLHKNIKFKDITNLLSQAKVYVHGKGFGTTEEGEPSEPEHFGISICEAMAAGCPAIVPRTGGCWTDISMYGKYCLGYSTLEELLANVKVLVNDKKQWTKWHELGLERVQAFDAEKLKPRIKGLLG